MISGQGSAGLPLLPAPSAHVVVAEVLAGVLERSGLTKPELAVRANTTVSHLTGYERGTRELTLPVLLRIVAAAGLDLRMRLHPIGGDPQAGTAGVPRAR